MKSRIIIIVLSLVVIAYLVSFIFPSHRVKEEKLEEFNITFDDKLLHSNLYPPKNLKALNITDSKVTISWQFDNKEIIVPALQAKEYAILSGFRIYRDGYWFADVGRDQLSITDDGLYPSETYQYKVAPLTFDNKIEGSSSAVVSIKTKRGSPGNVIPFTKKGVTSYLAEGDSIAEGQRAAKGNGWVDQVGRYLRSQNPNVKISNLSVSGSFASTVRERLKSEIDQTNPDLVTIAVGLNDLIAASRDIGNFSISEFREHLRKTLIISNPNKNRAVVLLNIYYFNCCFGEEDKTDKRLVWNKVIRDVANENGILLVDASDAMKESGGLNLIEDKLHPNQAGHDVIARAVIGTIKKIIK